MSGNGKSSSTPIIANLDRIKERLFSAVLSDVMDRMGHMSQAMSVKVRPLDSALVMVGRARTGFYSDVFEVIEGENPYETEITFVDDLGPGEIAVIGCGASGRIAPWGDLLSTASRARGAIGCVTDGMVRDTRNIIESKFPVFHGGIGPLDSRGRGKMTSTDTAIECGGVLVRSGDIVFGDADGVVVIPRQIEDEVLRLAFDKVDGEDNTKAELLKGTPLAVVFEKYGIL
ncbi:regulator of RNase E activity RraA [Mesorhizobium robiniae]|uniref:Regulator of RNase E activity RraA n=1 Tax=Mesorhizobium robiniae TaxID=559315 RepID=A0ABV2GFX7_9HYPH